MSTGFMYQGQDLDNILEGFGGVAPSPDFTGYTVTGTSLTNRYSGSTRDWEKTMTGGGYYYNGTLIPACLKGYRPTIGTIFYTLNGGSGSAARDITFTRTDSALTLSGDVSVSFGPSSFRNGKVPMCIGLLFCGGGGSFGVETVQSGMFNKETDYYYGGGGGGMALCVLSFDGLTDVPRLHLGNGGTGQSRGGGSFLYMGSTVTVRALGGYAGANTYSSGDGGGGSAGEAGSLWTAHPNVFFIQGHKGAKGCGQSNTVNDLTGCQFIVQITQTDSQRTFGTPPTHLAGGSGGEAYRVNRALGGGSMNGAYIYETAGGTDGAGGGGQGYSGGAGMVHMFY